MYEEPCVWIFVLLSFFFFSLISLLLSFYFLLSQCGGRLGMVGKHRCGKKFDYLVALASSNRTS